MRSVDDVIRMLPSSQLRRLATPLYSGSAASGVALAVEAMKRLLTDEGWQLMAGLERAGYLLCGRRCTVDEVSVPAILDRYHPGVVVVQDKCRWHANENAFRDLDAWFTRLDVLGQSPDVFKVAVLKDAQQTPEYHRLSAVEMGVHAWIIYYHPRVVRHLAPYVREEHLIRTYHSIDKDHVPPFDVNREGCVLAGAVSDDYPLRKRLFAARLAGVTCFEHPGYAMKASRTPDFLRMLSHFKVAVCTSSIYGYALRKIIEATASGCVVVTDLPADEVLPEIDGNLVRVHPSIALPQFAALLVRLVDAYDADRQRRYAEWAKTYYDQQAVGLRLAACIETLRSCYP
jgi:hypothetical protein